MLLDQKTAIIYGASGAIGSAVARAYAREGANVHLAGRTEATLDAVAQRIRTERGTAHVARVDVLDRAAVSRHASAVAAASGGIDVCFNATSNDDVQGTPLLDVQFEDFVRPVTKAVTAHFNVATAVGREMTRRGHGVILVMAGGREAIPRLGGSHVAWAALAGLCRQLAAEFGPHGVRVAWLLSPGSPDSDEQQHPTSHGEDEATPAPGTEGLLLNHQPSYDEVANVATFAASDWARTITASEINVTGGAVID
jgi:NAD(P)-dependent dehydrogenase (short-subunit alcohol dehydrogenase family)